MDFVFCFGKIDNKIDNDLTKQANNFWGDFEKIYCNDFLIIFPSNQNKTFMNADENLLGVIDGWGLDTKSNNNQKIKNFYRNLNNCWPILDESMSGCFSGLLFDKSRKILRIFSDISGIFPLYYSQQKNYWLGGTNLINLAHVLKEDFDLLGVLQRLTPPDYVNFGSRTVVKNIRKLLPGELIQINSNFLVENIYDNTLFSRINRDSIRDSAWALWETIKSDINSCVEQFKFINVGMSGGWDSRIIAGALQFSNVKKSYITYGESENEYEVEIAKKCAIITHANFQYCDIYENYFPSRDLFERNMKKTEGVFVTPWISVNESIPSNNFQPILLGDMFEVIVGRNIKSLTSRKSRKERLLDFSKKRTSQVEANFDDFEKWKEKKIESIVNQQLNQLTYINQDVKSDYSIKYLRDELSNDLESTFSRINQHNLPYKILQDELLGWYTHGISMGRQFLTLKENFSPLAITMGFRVLRESSFIDPFQRVNGNLLHEIQAHPDFSKLSQLPSAAIPIIPSNSPLFIKDIIWGARSIIDQKLINRAIKSKNKKGRMRLFKSINYVNLYNHPEAESRVKGWFMNYSYIENNNFVKLVVDRANLDEWPLVNFDIVGPASTMILLDLINKL